MSRISKFTGLEMDQAFAKALNLTYEENGFIKLQSSEAKPIDLDNVTQPGNYMVTYWTNGPTFSIPFKGPLNVYVCNINGITHQYTNCMSEYHSRTYEDGSFTGWVLKQSDVDVGLGDTPPENPDVNSIWLDTSVDPPVMKIFDGTNWNVIIPADMMRKSIYDPSNKSKDIYVAMEEMIAEKNIDYTQHIADSTIHVTQDEKDEWSAKATEDDIINVANELRTDLMNNVTEQAGTFSSSSEALTTTVAEYKETVDTHIADTTAHPSQALIDAWNAKAEGNHTHISDGRVRISADDIVSGVIPVERIDKSALERTYIVNTEEERLALTLEEVQEGDMVYVRNTCVYYFVTDDTKLSSEDGYLAFSIENAVLSWENILNKPTTLAGFGITDSYTKQEVTEKLDKFDSDLQYVKNTYEEISEINTINVADLISIQENLSSVNYTTLRDDTEGLLTEVTDFNNMLERLKVAVATYTSLI